MHTQQNSSEATQQTTAPHRHDARLRLLFTSDLHMHLSGFDYAADTPVPDRGLVHLAHLIAQARTQAQEQGATCLLFDNGDALQGTPLGHFAADKPDRPHPLMQAFDLLRYDAIGLGNHDFDFGFDTLRHILAQAPCPVICSNLHTSSGTELPIRASVILKPLANGPRIGLFACLPPQTAIWNAEFFRGRARVSDMLAAARKQVQDLRAKGCDLVVALAHTGTGSDLPAPMMEQAATVLDHMTGVDVVLGGHSHEVHPKTRQAGTLVVPGALGSHLGLVDLHLSRTADGPWVVTDAMAETRKCGPDTDPALVDLLTPCHQATRQRLDAPVGHSDRPLHSYFSLFGKDAGLALTARAQAAAILPQLQGSELAQLPVLSAIAPARFGGRGGPMNFTHVPAGPILERHIFDLCTFDNRLSAGVLTGHDIIQWLEMSAIIFATMAPGQCHTLIDPAVPGHNFDLIFGLTYDIDLSVPPRFHPDGDLRHPDSHRVRNICWQGQPLDPQQRFVVAMSSYRATGGGNVAALRNLTTVGMEQMSLRAVLRQQFSGGIPAGPLDAAPYPWRFAPLPGAFARVQTSPAARDLLSDLDLQATPDDALDPCGFLSLRLSL